jgi:hypothetical protein
MKKSKVKKQRRIERRRGQNLGSENVRKKRVRYARWAKMTPKQREMARSAGQKQFQVRP